jgi:hypothetical protein
MSDQEKAILDFERRIPLVSGEAFAAARAQTLAAGQSVLQSEQGALYEVFPDGTRRWLKAIEPATPVRKGEKIMLR